MRPSPAHAGKINPVALIGVAVLVVAIVLVAVLAISGRSASRLEPFPTQAYLESPQNYLGNAYRIDAQVDSMLKYKPGLGRLLVVKSDGQPIPVFLPEGLIESIHTGQRYHLDVSIGAGGQVYINDLEKY